MLAIAIGVTCPYASISKVEIVGMLHSTRTIMVLNAKVVIVEIETPFALVRVSKISAGMIQLRGPTVAEKV